MGRLWSTLSIKALHLCPDPGVLQPSRAGQQLPLAGKQAGGLGHRTDRRRSSECKVEAGRSWKERLGEPEGKAGGIRSRLRVCVWGDPGEEPREGGREPGRGEEGLEPAG